MMLLNQLDIEISIIFVEFLKKLLEFFLQNIREGDNNEEEKNYNIYDNSYNFFMYDYFFYNKVI